MASYLNIDCLEALDSEAFRATEPYPWINPVGALTDEGYHRLLDTLPDSSLFEPSFMVKRSHGQQSHDRYSLEYRESLDMAEPWHTFVEELRGRAYGRFLRRMFGRGRIWLNFHWHYTPSGCSVSPHCDAMRKLGSHIFYLNTSEDWDPAWGGETLILNGKGRFPFRSAPRFEDFDEPVVAKTLDNRSLLFARRDESWHGMREIHCPPGALRKVFIVVVNDSVMTLGRRLKARLNPDAAVGY